MLHKIIKRSFINQKKAMTLMVASIAVGTSLVSSLLTLSFEIASKVSRELRSFGANIIIEPKIEGLADLSGQKRYLKQSDILKTKTIFWRHNITGVCPFLESTAKITYKGLKHDVRLLGAWFDKQLPLPGEERYFTVGIKTVFPWWDINGNWPNSTEQIIIGKSLASKLGISIGEDIYIEGKKFNVSGIIQTGGQEDDNIIMELETLQGFKNLNERVSKVFISAMTTPMDEFAYRDPLTMTKAEYEKWYCTGYVTSIAKQLEEVFEGARAKPVWNIAEAEGKVLNKLKALIYLLCMITILTSALGVSTTMIMSILRRMEEIGLMKAIGADTKGIAVIFLTEGFITGIVGGMIGYALSAFLSQYIGLMVFGTELKQKDILLPVAVGSAIFISIIGTILPIKKALRIRPSTVMRGN